MSLNTRAFFLIKMATDCWVLVLERGDDDVPTLKSVRVVCRDAYLAFEKYMARLLNIPCIVSYGLPLQWWQAYIDADGTLAQSLLGEKRKELDWSMSRGRSAMACEEPEDIAFQYTVRDYLAFIHQ